MGNRSIEDEEKRGGGKRRSGQAAPGNPWSRPGPCDSSRSQPPTHLVGNARQRKATPDIKQEQGH